MLPLTVRISGLASVQYIGNNGETAACIDALVMLIHAGIALSEARLITHDRRHAFVIKNQCDDIYVIKGGFTSGYSGEGPRGLADALQLLHRHHVRLDEHDVSSTFMHRLRNSCLTQRDVDLLMKSRPICPRRWWDYIEDVRDGSRVDGSRLRQHYPVAVPFRLIDDRLFDLALSFDSDHDKSITSAYRRLEDQIRRRTGLAGESGTKLFSKAFLADTSPLTWAVEDDNEAKSRANLFVSVFGAYRNARMHREAGQEPSDALREFLLVNELFLLEATSIPRQLK